jgi:hypothetical protein
MVSPTAASSTHRNDDCRGAAICMTETDLQEIDMSRTKPVIIAAVAALTMGVAALPGQAHANDNALLGGLIGAGIGAAIGHNVHGRDGAVVGGAIGAIAGASIGARSTTYYDGGYYPAPASVYAPAPGYYGEPVYYGEASTYYGAAPAYYPRVQYAPRIDYDHYYGVHRSDRGRSFDHGGQGSRGGDRRHGR